MVWQIILGVIGLSGVLVGADLVVNGARAVAKRYGISDFFIGLTVLSIGTSLPEIFTHIIASLNILNGTVSYATASGIAIGTNIGSNLIQISLITGVVGLLGILRATKKFMNFDYIVMLGAILLLWVFAFDHSIARWEGITMVVAYLVYLYVLTKKEGLFDEREDLHAHSQKYGQKMWMKYVFILMGFLLLAFGADRVLESALYVTDYLGVGGSLIGTLVIGVATALPELTTAIIGIFKKAGGMSIGTLVGSNITNPMLGIGLGAAISTYVVDNAILWFDIPVWFGISVVAFFLLYNNKMRMPKWGAGLLCTFYIVFMLSRLWLCSFCS